MGRTECRERKRWLALLQGHGVGGALRIPMWECPKVRLPIPELLLVYRRWLMIELWETLGKAGGGGWQEKSDARIPGNVNLKG